MADLCMWFDPLSVTDSNEVVSFHSSRADCYRCVLYPADRLVCPTGYGGVSFVFILFWAAPEKGTLSCQSWF